MDFSEREGLGNPRSNQIGSMDNILKNAIWTEAYEIIDKEFVMYGITGYGDATFKDDHAQLLWTDFFIKSRSELPYAGKFLSEVEPFYHDLAWNKVYDLVEFLISLDNFSHKYTKKFNSILMKHNSGYRLINNIVQPIASKEVVDAMKSAYEKLPTQQTKDHLFQAQRLYSQKTNPDFNNSCLESIKAVEGLCREILNNSEILGENIKKLKHDKKYNQHIIAMLERLNAFRGDVSAHATRADGYSPRLEDAVLIHTISCGFINYFLHIQT